MTKLTLNVVDDEGAFYTTMSADTIDGLFDEIARRSEQLAAYAATRNAVQAFSVRQELFAEAAQVERPLEKGLSGGASAGKPAPSGPSNTVDQPVETRPTVDYDAVKAKVQQVATTKGRQSILAVLTAFGVDHATKLTPNQWPAALEALDKELAS